MGADDRTKAFERLTVPHLPAAFNLARWLLRNDADAADVVQEAYLRALRFFEGFRSPSARGWLLAIVRNCAHDWLQKNRAQEILPIELDDDDGRTIGSAGAGGESPLASLVRKEDQRQINEAIEALPVAYREVFILRELEDLSYKEIAEIANIPIGTVMSRLSRARRELQRRLSIARDPP